jgi:hypothetical protein
LGQRDRRCKAGGNGGDGGDLRFHEGFFARVEDKGSAEFRAGNRGL